ncbi:microsomal signal peptidase 12kDa subunit [Cokeromyces recurvatus]|uniref:microsomal signal peptidase 12kDa subunit n=1 Tax=Cokeromyces recurvatus TaxID=90255 RepID=UPI00221F8481|nr:microsomal signal peptidase 12kDa subunit [Cokeromyces recurvatus]KAI7904671.1 microsomal signal peptidase 12kDa subunit [Cokeromyces recurvatus]
MALADILECTIDFEGQKKTEQLLRYFLFASAFTSFTVGYCMSSIQLLMIVFCIGLILTALVIIPPWPAYNKHPQPFIKLKEEEKKD